MSDKNIERAHEEVISILLRYDLIESRAVEWRKKNNINIRHKLMRERINLKYHFFYGDPLDPDFSESVFTIDIFSKGLKQRIKKALRKYPSLKCYTSELICCGAHFDNLRALSGVIDILCCRNCDRYFTLMPQEVACVHTLRHGYGRLKRLRNPAIIIWESR